MSLPLNSISTRALAYLGDSVLEIRVRRFLVYEKGLSRSGDLNQAALLFVSAPAQAEAMQKILPLLEEEEAAVFHRGRNLGHSKTPKSATVAQYRAATGMEVLFGYLSLSGREDRIDELFAAGFSEQLQTTSF